MSEDSGGEMGMCMIAYCAWVSLFFFFFEFLITIPNDSFLLLKREFCCLSVSTCTWMVLSQ